jgi:hypothetical protein
LLLVGLAPLTDDDFRAPSLLPRYSRAPVVTHIANKSKAHVLIFGGPAAGEIRRLHPDGYDPDLAADLGASRSAAELRSDLAPWPITCATSRSTTWISTSAIDVPIGPRSWSRVSCPSASDRFPTEPITPSSSPGSSAGHPHPS